MEMFHERALQMTVVGTHSFCAASPWRDRALGQCFGRIGNHQIGIDNWLCPQAVAGRASAQMTVERKMFRSELTQPEAGLRVSVIGRVAAFFPPDSIGLNVGCLLAFVRSTTTRFPPHLRAVSIESVRRTRIPSRTTSRSTTASIVCRSPFLSRMDPSDPAP